MNNGELIVEYQYKDSDEWHFCHNLLHTTKDDIDKMAKEKGDVSKAEAAPDKPNSKPSNPKDLKEA